MKTYRTPEGEYPEYTKFARAHTTFVTWIPLLVAENRVRFYALSNLVEVVDPRLTGMVYDQPAIPQNFDSGLLYTVPEPPKALTVIMPVSAAEAISHTNVRILKFTDVSLWHEGLRVA